MNLEYAVLMCNDTWTLVPCSSSMNVVSNNWVFRVKYNADSSVEKCKAYLVTKGFLQTLGLDFFKTFSFVIKLTTIRLVLTIVLSQEWSIRQLDFNNAFLNGDLSETIYMTQPKEYLFKDHPTHVYKLKNTLHDLK